MGEMQALKGIQKGELYGVRTTLVKRICLTYQEVAREVVSSHRRFCRLRVCTLRPLELFLNFQLATKDVEDNCRFRSLLK